MYTPYNSIFEGSNDDNVYHLTKNPEITLLKNIQKYTMDSSYVPTADNSTLYDDNTHQQLKQDDIKNMIDNNEECDNIITSLANSSSTFSTKTQYSQEKWINKKIKKYSKVLYLRKTTINHLLDIHRNYLDPKRIMYLRDDIVSFILYFIRINYKQHTIIIENTNGFLTGALLLKHGGHGRITQIYIGKNPSIPFIKYFNISSKNLSILNSIPITSITTNNLLYGNALIICTMYDPLQILQRVISNILPSCPIIVFCPFLEPLTFTQKWLLKNHLATHVQIRQQFFRKIKVLHNRTHPDMSMNTTGYILIAITLLK